MRLANAAPFQPTFVGRLGIDLTNNNTHPCTGILFSADVGTEVRSV